MKTGLDVIVVGSGCSGAMAAQTLLEGGAKVTMIDVGMIDDTYANSIPEKDYLTIRKTELDQYKYFIGEHGEGIGWSDIGKGAQITPPRQHMVRSVDTLIPMTSKTFSPVESLGYGGLGIGWGLQCWQYSKKDMIKTGLDVDRMHKAYDLVSSRIGISATNDSGSKYTMGALSVFQPSPSMDRNHDRINKKYIKKQSYFNKNGLHIGRTPLALITKDLGERKGYKYLDMDFYSDKQQSAWRPWITVNKLRENSNFNYKGGQLVTRFRETDQGVEVTSIDLSTHKEQITVGRKLVLAAGALGSARIVLRSYNHYDRKIPLLCNPYTYIPCIQPALLGKGAESKKLGFAQLSVFLDKNEQHFDTSVASLYSYQSLMMFRTIRQLPLNFLDGKELLRYLQTGLVIMGVHHPDKASPDKFLSLSKDAHSPTGDHLVAGYELSEQDKHEYRDRERKIISAMRHTGLHALKSIDPGNGASIHYAGTLPFSESGDELTLAKNGRLNNTKHVYVADSSGFNYLPAQGLTFSLLANAHITAENVLNA